jgi:peptidoglycan/LPS O-acetylase OafA/YrhL
LLGFALTRPIIGWSSYWTIWLETIFGATIVALLAFGPFPPSSASAFRAARFLGKISFSFYLLSPIALLPQHHGISEYLTSAISAGAHPLLVCAGLFVCAVVLTALLAWLQFNFIERPGIIFGRTISVGLSTPAAPIPTPPRAGLDNPHESLLSAALCIRDETPKACRSPQVTDTFRKFQGVKGNLADATTAFESDAKPSGGFRVPPS